MIRSSSQDRHLKLLLCQCRSSILCQPGPAENDPIWSNYPDYRYNAEYDPNDSRYMSGVIMSREDYVFTHGYAEARIKPPAGQGLWSAFWLLSNYYVERVPEIDVVEVLGHLTDRAYHTYHYFELKMTGA